MAPFSAYFTPGAPEAGSTPEAPEVEGGGWKRTNYTCHGGQDARRFLDRGFPVLEKRSRSEQGADDENDEILEKKTWPNKRQNDLFPSLVREGNLDDPSISGEVASLVREGNSNPSLSTQVGEDATVGCPVGVKPECPVPYTTTTSLHPAGSGMQV